MQLSTVELTKVVNQFKIESCGVIVIASMMIVTLLLSGFMNTPTLVIGFPL